MTMFLARFGTIAEVEVQSVKGKSVTLLDGRKDRIKNSYTFYATTKKEAKDWIVSLCRKELAVAQRTMDYHARALIAAENL